VFESSLVNSCCGIIFNPEENLEELKGNIHLSYLATSPNYQICLLNLTS
jgi:hypothetical protein